MSAIRTIALIFIFGPLAAMLVEPFFQTLFDLLGWDSEDWAGPAMNWVANNTAALTLLMGLGGGVWVHYFASKLNKKRGIIEAAPRALLRLRFHGNTSTPDELYSENISNWFSFFTKSLSLSNEQKGSLVEVHPDWFLSVRFHHPVSYRQVKVSITGADHHSPQVQVQGMFASV